MNIKLYYSKLSKCASDYVLQDLANRDKKYDHIVIVPDRSNFTYESRLFSKTQEQCFMDLEVSSFTRLANRYITNTHSSFRVLSKNGAVAIIKKIMLENIKELQSFSKSIEYKGFASNLFNTICMFKSSGITPDKIDCNITDISLSRKLHDIKLIYSKYEEYLSDVYTDSFNRLNLFCDLINADNFKNCDIYFLGWDDFTKQQYAIIEKFMKFAHSVTLSCSYDSKSANSKIYLNNIYLNVCSLAKLNGADIQITEVPYSSTADKMFVVNNALTFNSKIFEGENNFISLTNYSNIDDEVNGVISSIKQKVIFDNCKYKDFAIAVSDINLYKNVVLSTMHEYNVDYFLDESETLNNFSEIIVVDKLIELVYSTKYSVLLNILKSSIFDFDIDSLNKLEKHYIKYNSIGNTLFEVDYPKLNNTLSALKDYIASTKQCKTISEYISCLNKVLQDIQYFEHLQSLQQKYYALSKIENYKKIEQVVSKLQSVFKELNDILGNYECSIKYFKSIIESYFENTTISLPPIVSDCVFVGDISNSYYTDYKYLYVLGVQDKSFPQVLDDCGIILDSELIKLEKQHIALNPTIAFTNKKNKFKAFETLFCGDNVYLSYHVTSNDGIEYVSPYVSNMFKQLNTSTISGIAEHDLTNNNLEQLNTANIISNNFNLQTAYKNVISQLKFWNNHNDNKHYINMLSTIVNATNGIGFVKNHDFINNKCNINSTNNFYFVNNRASVSEWETFASCPYKHFAQYGLKLQNEEISDIQANDIGDILHKYLELIVPIITKTDNVNLNTLANVTLDKVISDPKYDYLKLNAQNRFTINSLYSEAVLIAKAVQYHKSMGSFTPIAQEYVFGKDKNIVTISRNGYEIVVSGKIDRIDEANGYFRIIDYKTGKEEFSDFSDIYYGRKVQLIVYMKMYGINTSLKPIGAFYMPIKNNVSDKQDILSRYKLEGILLKNLESLSLYDSNLNGSKYSSKIIDASYTTDGKLSNSGASRKGLMLSEQEISHLGDWVWTKINQLTDEIISGEITPKPLDKSGKSACDYCQYKGMCNFNEKYGNSKVQMQKVSFADLSNNKEAK